MGVARVNLFCMGKTPAEKYKLQKYHVNNVIQTFMIMFG